MVETETEECIDQTAGTRSADYLSFLAEAEMKAVDADQCLDMDDSPTISRSSLIETLLC